MTNAEGLVHYHAAKEGFVYQDENITVTAIPTRHMTGGEPSFPFPISSWWHTIWNPLPYKIYQTDGCKT